MNQIESVQQYLNEEGYCSKEADYGLAFKCEGKNYIMPRTLIVLNGGAWKIVYTLLEE